MADFSQYKKSDVQPEQVEVFTFFDLEGQPQIATKPATKHNKSYQKAAKAKAPVLSRLMRNPGAPGADQQSREIAARLCADHLITNWGESPPVDSSGTAVAFTPDNAYDFLLAVPSYMFDDMSNPHSFLSFVGNPRNFTKDAADPDDAKEMAGN